MRLSDINNNGESLVKAERKYNAASKDGTKLSMPNDENSKKLNRGTKTVSYTHLTLPTKLEV